MRTLIQVAMTDVPQPDRVPAASASPLSDPRIDGDRRIVRDATFSRAVVDDIVPLPLGRDIELSCLQYSPIFNAMIDKGDHYVPDVEVVYAEVARIRISVSEAIELAMSIISQGIQTGKVNGDKVAASILTWTKEAAEAGQNRDVDAG